MARGSTHVAFKTKATCGAGNGANRETLLGLAVGISALRRFSEGHPATVFSRDRCSLVGIVYFVLVLINAMRSTVNLSREQV